MSSHAYDPQPRLRSVLNLRRLKPAGVTPFAIFALLVWTSLLVPVMGIKGARFGVAAFLMMMLSWVAVLIVRFSRGRDFDYDLEFASLWMSTVALGYLAASVTSATAFLVGAIIAITASAILCNRYPVGAVTLLCAASGAYGTVQATWGFGVGPVVHIVLAGLWAGLIWRVATRQRARNLSIAPAMWLVFIYVGITFAELSTAETFYIGIRTISTSTWYMLAAVAIGYAGWDRDTYEKIARVLVVTAVGVGGYALLRHFTGPTASEKSFALAVGSGYNTVDGKVRLFGSTGGGHDLAVWATCAVPYCLGCALGWRGWWRYIAMAGAALCVFALFGTEVRAAIPALLGGVIVTMAVFILSPSFGIHRLSVGVVSSAAVAAVAIAFFLALGTNSTERYNGLLHPKSDSSFSERTYKWGAAIKDIKRHPAGLGLGSAGFQHARYGRFFLTSNLTIENSYLVIAYQEGFAVMALFALMVLALIVMIAVKTVTSKYRERATLSVGAAGSLTGFAILMISGPYVEGFPALWVWLIVGLGIAQFTFRDAPAEAGRP